jgi:hypothetical protein
VQNINKPTQTIVHKSPREMIRQQKRMMRIPQEKELPASHKKESLSKL